MYSKTIGTEVCFIEPIFTFSPTYIYFILKTSPIANFIAIIIILNFYHV